MPEFIDAGAAALKKLIQGPPLLLWPRRRRQPAYNVGDDALLARRDEVSRIVYDQVAALGGSISAEHGLGQLKRDEITRDKAPLELELMRAVKRALDPQGLMNPGKVI